MGDLNFALFTTEFDREVHLLNKAVKFRLEFDEGLAAALSAASDTPA